MKARPAAGRRPERPPRRRRNLRQPRPGRADPHNRLDSEGRRKPAFFFPHGWRDTAAMNDTANLAPQPLDRARALHARYYTDPAIGALERRVIFDRGWQLVAHVCQLRNAGDHAIADFAGLPVIAVRGVDGAGG